MTGLRERQSRFLAALVDGDTLSDLGAGGSRMDIYRNNYRSSLVRALESTFERTARLAGRDAFRQAAIHHIIGHPPTSWTLDHVGEGFPDTCRELFANDPDVAEVAWLEWAMARAFTARDACALTRNEFATRTAAFDDDGWANLQLRFLPGTLTGAVRFDLPRLWQSLACKSVSSEVRRAERRSHVVVWREAEAPVFQLVPFEEGRCLETMAGGARLGRICSWLGRRHDADEAARRAGWMLHHWLELGVVETIVESRGRVCRPRTHVN